MVIFSQSLDLVAIAGRCGRQAILQTFAPIDLEFYGSTRCLLPLEILVLGFEMTMNTIPALCVLRWMFVALT